MDEAEKTIYIESIFLISQEDKKALSEESGLIFEYHLECRGKTHYVPLEALEMGFYGHMLYYKMSLEES